MNRPPRAFYALVLAAELVAALLLLVAGLALVAHRVHPTTSELFTPQGARPVGSPGAEPPTGGANTRPTPPASSTELPSPATALPSTTAPGATGARIDPAVACSTTWQVTRATPTGRCVLPNGAGYTPVMVDCVDGRQLVVGDPNTTGTLAGYVGERLTAVDREQAVELAAQCQG